MTFKPLLAGKASTEDFAKLKFPLMGSPKLDGLRCLGMSGVATSRTMKAFPNAYVQEFFTEHADALEGLDGELIVGDPFGPDVYERTQGPIMRREGEPNFTFRVFDYWSSTLDYTHRYKIIHDLLNFRQLPDRVKLVPSSMLHKLDDLELYEEACLKIGYEGIMLRDPKGVYKHGRSSLREGILLKVKRLDDMEVRLVGYEEEMANNNEAEKDAFGRTKRSSHQANKSGKGRLGAWEVIGVNGPFKGVTFNVGTGLSADERERYWAERDTLLGSFATVRYMPIGSKDRPRHPRWKGFRGLMDFDLNSADINVSA